MPAMNTSGNSSPFAVCSVISCTAVAIVVVLMIAALERGLIEKLVELRHRTVAHHTGVVEWQHHLTAELPTRRDQFFEVLLAREPAFASLARVKLEQPADLDAVLRELVQRQAFDRDARSVRSA